MTKEDIARMAREAGFTRNDADEVFLRVFEFELERFTDLVAAQEREACAEVAEQELLNTSALMSLPPQSSAAWNILNAIRARGAHED